jgi:hypothetical protein
MHAAPNDESKAEQAFLLRVLQGDTEALAFIELFFEIVQTWDDLVDQDEPVSPERANQAFLAAMVRLPRNTFYQRHAPELQPVMEQAYLDWLTANQLEQGDRHQQVLAFVLRERVATVLVRAATLIGGFDYGRSIAPEVWLANHDGTLEDYLEGLHHVDRG